MKFAHSKRSASDGVRVGSRPNNGRAMPYGAPPFTEVGADSTAGKNSSSLVKRGLTRGVPSSVEVAHPKESGSHVSDTAPSASLCASSTTTGESNWLLRMRRMQGLRQGVGRS